MENINKSDKEIAQQNIEELDIKEQDKEQYKIEGQKFTSQNLEFYENTPSDLLTEKFLRDMKSESTNVKPSQELLTETLEKISVTNQPKPSINIIENFKRKAVNNLSILNETMKIPFKIIVPIGIIAVLTVVFLLRPTTAKPMSLLNSLNGKNQNVTTNTQDISQANNDITSGSANNANSQGNSVDASVNSILGFNDDATVANGEDSSTDASSIDTEVSTGYAEPYENY